MSDPAEVITTKDSSTGGRWYVKFPNGSVIARSYLEPIYEKGRLIYYRYFDPVKGIEYRLMPN